MQIDGIEVPGPEQVGPANVYLLQGEKNILIDTGPRREDTFQALKEGLDSEGLEIGDIDLVLITHPHSDHFGNASRFRQEGADIAIHEEAASIVEDYTGYLDEQQEKLEDFFRRHGVPREENSGLMKKAIPPQEECSVEVDIPLSEGDEIGGIEVVDAPGHSVGSAVFVHDEDAFVGDTVLKSITPNPMISIGFRQEPGENLVSYLETLEKLRKMQIDRMRPGHGEVIREPGQRIDEILEHHRERKQKVQDMIEEERSAFEVMRDMFDDLPREKYLFGMSEAIGHLELLVREGKAEKLETEEKIKYRAAH